MWVPQRHLRPASPSRISCSVALGLFSSNAVAVMIQPPMQYSHWPASSAIKAFCIGCGLSAVPSPSSVRISPLTALTGMTQERSATPSTMTVQAPHCARPQPNFGPFLSSSFLSAYKSGMPGSLEIVCSTPSTVSVNVFFIGVALRDGLKSPSGTR